MKAAYPVTSNPIKTLANRKYIWTIIIFIVFGVVLLLLVKAASNSTSIQPETGTVSSNAKIVDDVSASNGKSVRFTSTTSGNSCATISNLQFCDDFNGANGQYPDSTKWNVYSSGSSWGSQCWKKDPENISLDGQGYLKQTIVDKGTVQCTNYYGTPSSFTSGAMDTKGKFMPKYGRFEIRAKLACADSVWGAIWLATGTGPAWPRSGEIDIYEITGNRFSKLKQTVFIPTIADPSKAKSVSTYVDLPNGQRWCDEFHVYGLEWRKDSLQFLVDGAQKAKVTPADIPSDTTWPFNDYDLKMLIDLQYGQTGMFTGDPIPSQLPTTMLVDYVRVYN